MNALFFLAASLSCLMACVVSLRCATKRDAWRGMHIWIAAVSGYVAVIYFLAFLAIAELMIPFTGLKNGTLVAVGVAMLALIVAYSIIAQGCKFGRK